MLFEFKTFKVIEIKLKKPAKPKYQGKTPYLWILELIENMASLNIKT